MSHPQLPKIIAALLRAANARDTAALLATLAGDAVLTDMGRRFAATTSAAGATVCSSVPILAVRPIDVTERDGSPLVSVVLHGKKPDTRTHIRRDWRFTIEGTRIAALDMAATAEPDLPPSVAAFVRSTNARDLEGLMAVFAEDAMVNDDLQERWGKAAIRKWAEEEFIGQRVTIFVVKCVAQHYTAVVTAHVDGDFDQRGLPYPLVLTFYFSMNGSDIIQLIVLRNQPD